ncbi:MAG: hypothetical protein PWQ50_184 [Methanolobus sp.]|jgi:hypothetical protein|nr:hypothetical protein [Methanolobus sp.]
MINLRDVQSHFDDNWIDICEKPIVTMWFLKEPTRKGVIVNTHHLLDKIVKPVFGTPRICQPNFESSHTVEYITKEVLENTKHMEYVNGFKKIMDTKVCPYCERPIDAIEMKIKYSRVDSIKLLHFSATPDTSRGYSYQSCPLNEKEFYDLQLTPQ